MCLHYSSVIKLLQFPLWEDMVYGLQFIKLNTALLEPGRLSTALYNIGIKKDNVIKNIRLINDKSDWHS